MKPDEARALYGERYAGLYDELWEESPLWAPEAKLHVQALDACITPTTRWLDVGCGTGWILSQFPGTTRAGIDLSPAMLERASAANPDALLFREGDIRDDVPEWFGGWDLVSSTGHAWCYVDTIDEVRRIAENMARWTAPGGTLFVQPPDLCDLTGTVIPYNFSGEPPSEGSLAITAAVWTFHDAGGAHENMVWPSLDLWVRWLSQWFHRVEVHTWPREPEFLPCPRKVVYARGRRRSGELDPTEVVLYPAPDAPDDAEPHAFPSAVVPSPVAPSATPAAGGRPTRLVDRPLSELAHRAAPWRPHLWRALGSRARRGARRLRRAAQARR